MAAAALAVSLVLTLCRTMTPSPRLWVIATAFVPLAVLGYAVAALLWWAVLGRDPGRWRAVATFGLVLSLVGLLFHVALLVPSYAGGHATGRSELTVMTSNQRLGQADPHAVARIASGVRADVVVLEEVTPAEMGTLTVLRDTHPYVAGEAAPWGYGTVVLSRYPLSDVTQLKVSKGAWSMRVAAPRPFWLVAVHTAQPLADYRSYGPDHDAIQAAVSHLDGPVVVAGDFNSTLDQRPMRRLLDAGLSDAARQSNAGWQATWPVDQRDGRLKPFGLGLMTLDHVLCTRDFSAVSTSTLDVRGSDHLALVARLAER